MPISDAEILALTPKPKPYKVYVGKGAFLLVMPNGHKYWRLKYYLNGKQNDCSLGVFPNVSVDAMRVACDSTKALVRQGINPAVARREARRIAACREPLFWLELSKSGELTIVTGTKDVTLTVAQTQALAAFLIVSNEHEKDCQ
jgi:hypothetical protein